MLAWNVATPERPVLIGDLVHLSDVARPQGRRCTPAIATRVLSRGDGLRERLQLHEMTDGAGVAKAKYPSGGWRHVLGAPDAPATWHMRAECPEER